MAFPYARRNAEILEKRSGFCGFIRLVVFWFCYESLAFWYTSLMIMIFALRMEIRMYFSHWSLLGHSGWWTSATASTTAFLGLISVCLSVCLSVSCLATTKLAKWALGNTYVDARIMKAWQIEECSWSNMSFYFEWFCLEACLSLCFCCPNCNVDWPQFLWFKFVVIHQMELGMVLLFPNVIIHLGNVVASCWNCELSQFGSNSCVAVLQLVNTIWCMFSFIWAKHWPAITP